ncbi:MAG: 5-(carboxyamino)imidazole ribonucleotide synthase, partial [Hyphomicrobiales bacterium]|nr:5-(carboxyamino)imidazole ribonucleotide synthase [Hyphomicrobiales bacterium]
LGRMLALAAAKLGLRCHIYCPDAESPAFEVAAAHTVAAYDDAEALDRFADAVDVVTYEFENVPGETAAILAAKSPVRPGANALAVSQDRLSEKTFIAGLGIEVAPFHAVDDGDDLARALDALGGSGVLKTRRFGYDGKGQVMIRSADEAGAALQPIGHQPAILEGFVTFEREVSVVIARSIDGAVEGFDPAANVHEHHILKWSRVPAGIAAETEAAAVDAARRIAAALDYAGVLSVEFFLVKEGGHERLIVNEIAPRVHNSGHWTESAATVSQFEQHIRAIAGWPLGRPLRHSDVEMENLIGDDVERWVEIIAEPGAHLHLYGKRQTRPGRKMGHVNRLKPRSDRG